MVNIAYAASGSVDSFIMKVNELIINPLIVLLFAVALIYFLYGVLQFFTSPESEEKKTVGKNHMLWGVIGLTIMMGVFAIMNIILRTFNITGVKPETGEVKLDAYNPTFPPVNN